MVTEGFANNTGGRSPFNVFLVFQGVIVLFLKLNPNDGDKGRNVLYAFCILN